MIEKSLFRLDGKVALITGGGSGIGYGIASSFVNAGAKVIIVGRKESRLKEACSNLGGMSQYLVFDLNNLVQIPSMMEMIENEIGDINILVNNAGKHYKNMVVNTSDEDFLSVIQTNLLSVFALTRECAKSMLRRKEGVIILISSMVAGVAMDQVVGYSAAKTALLGMMRTMTMEFAASNIRVNAIAPGWINSNMLEMALKGDPERRAKILAKIPTGKFGDPVDIGNAAVFLSSDASTYINNAFLTVDGGAFQSL